MHWPHPKVGDISLGRHDEDAVRRVRMVDESKGIKLVRPPNAVPLRMEKGLGTKGKTRGTHPLATQSKDIGPGRESMCAEDANTVYTRTRQHQDGERRSATLRTIFRRVGVLRENVVTIVRLGVEQRRLQHDGSRPSSRNGR